MDDLEDCLEAADDRIEKTEREREAAAVERGDEKPAVEPFDPYFGRRKGEKFFWA